MNMQVGQAETRGSRRLYLPTIAIAAAAAWLSWRGWTVPVEQAGRLGRTMLSQLAEPFTSIRTQTR